MGMRDKERMHANADLYDRLLRSIAHHAPEGDKIERIVALRGAARDFTQALCKLTTPSREQSLAATHLEETVMWAVKSIVLEEQRGK